MDHPPHAVDGLSFVIQFWTDRMYGFGDIAMFRFWQCGLKMPIHAPFWVSFWGTFSLNNVLNNVLIILTPKRTVLGSSHAIWAIKREYWPRGSSSALERENKGQDRTGKKSQKVYISPIWGEAPTEAICIKNCVKGNLVDIITCTKFQNETFRGYHFAGGRIFPFPIDI